MHGTNFTMQRIMQHSKQKNTNGLKTMQTYVFKLLAVDSVSELVVLEQRL